MRQHSGSRTSRRFLLVFWKEKNAGVEKRGDTEARGERKVMPTGSRSLCVLWVSKTRDQNHARRFDAGPRAYRPAATFNRFSCRSIQNGMRDERRRGLVRGAREQESLCHGENKTGRDAMTLSSVASASLRGRVPVVIYQLKPWWRRGLRLSYPSRLELGGGSGECRYGSVLCSKGGFQPLFFHLFVCGAAPMIVQLPSVSFFYSSCRERNWIVIVIVIVIRLLGCCPVGRLSRLLCHSSYSAARKTVESTTGWCSGVNLHECELCVCVCAVGLASFHWCLGGKCDDLLIMQVHSLYVTS